MPSIRSIGTAIPKHQYDNRAILNAAKLWLADQPIEMALFERFVGSAQTAERYFTKPVEEILSYNGMAHRAEIFETSGVDLGAVSLENAFKQGSVEPNEVDSFIFTSCSAPVIPSIDASLIERLNLNKSVTRLPIYQHGCAGGVIGLSLANRLAKDGRPVVLTSVELCSLGFQAKDHTAGHLVGSAIFGDGAASVIITPDDNGLVFLDTQSVLTENSRHLMGYDIFDDGAHLRLDKELPGFLAQCIPKLVPAFLKRNGLTETDINWWLFHPGGAKILTALEEAFNIDREKAVWAREVLKNYGNLSSASILFVTSEFLKSNIYRDRELVLMVGVGPGLTVEMILFEVRLRKNEQSNN